MIGPIFLYSSKHNSEPVKQNPKKPSQNLVVWFSQNPDFFSRKKTSPVDLSRNMAIWFPTTEVFASKIPRNRKPQSKSIFCSENSNLWLLQSLMLSFLLVKCPIVWWFNPILVTIRSNPRKELAVKMSCVVYSNNQSNISPNKIIRNHTRISVPSHFWWLKSPLFLIARNLVQWAFLILKHNL